MYGYGVYFARMGMRSAKPFVTMVKIEKDGLLTTKGHWSALSQLREPYFHLQFTSHMPTAVSDHVNGTYS